jgi:hypothetical protein
MAVFKNCRLVTGAICKASNQDYLFEVKERFFTLAPARRMPQRREKPAPASSLTNFKSIGYRDAGACSSSTGSSFRRY